ncbi:MAG: Ig-like domain-containing protein, partial [Polaromonas sp.]|nr:Ig-like domain-containing protein [Polaromonas sp.]
DLLTVLIHELGHVLGAQDLPRPEDVMSGHLEAGVRRLPSAQDVAQWLVNQSQRSYDTTQTAGFGVRVTSLTVTGSPADNTPVVIAEPALANATLTSGSLDAPDGWMSQGSVAIGSGSATLSEAAASQSRLSQVFMLGAQDRYLSFTVNGLALDDAANGPDDAFEVALLDAGSGASLTSAIALSRTDALLNIQASGAELAAQGVTHVTNPDGSRTYLVDLSGIARSADGTAAVNLSFDLIGFGATAQTMSSHVSISDVRLLGLQTQDDSITSAEDSVAQIVALANDTGATQSGFAPVVLAAPAHGQVLVNADSTFSYTPAQDWFGADSFTYKVSNGAVDSNVSTVSITVSPVNDAPVAADASAAASCGARCARTAVRGPGSTAAHPGRSKPDGGRRQRADRQPARQRRRHRQRRAERIPRGRPGSRQRDGQH